MRASAASTGSKLPAARLRVGFILANHFTLTAFSTFVDTLRLAADEGDGSRQIHSSWTVMSASGKPVRASCGVELLPQSELVAPGRFDYIAVIGGLLHKGSQIDAATTAYLKSAATAGVTKLSAHSHAHSCPVPSTYPRFTPPCDTLPT